MSSTDYDFWGILKRVSRSFYLSLVLLPPATRRVISLAYLLARAADSISDTPLIDRGERREYLALFRKCLQERRDERGETMGREEAIVAKMKGLGDRFAGDPTLQSERDLLLHIEPCFDEYSSLSDVDQPLVYRVLDTIIAGMEFDLDRFPGGSEKEITGLDRWEETDRYCYMVAGVVGEFWTEAHLAHYPDLSPTLYSQQVERGIRFGKALQLTNILRDVYSDLFRGRCYLPRPLLKEVSLVPADLLEEDSGTLLQPVIDELLEVAMDHFYAGIDYLQTIPTSHYRLRLSCILPLAIGIRTLGLLQASPALLRPQPIKIARREVYSILAKSSVAVLRTTWTASFFRRLLVRSGFSPKRGEGRSPSKMA